MQIKINKIKTSPFQPRLEFDLKNLKESIKRHGILDPLRVRGINEDHYELIDGEQRLRVAKELELETVPCSISKVDDAKADLMVWQINTRRNNYSSKEKAIHFKYHRDAGMTLEAIADEHGVGETTVRHYLAIFKLPTKYQNLLWTGKINMGIFNIVFWGVGIEGENALLEVTKFLDQIIKEDLGKRQVERLISSYLEKKQAKVHKASEKIIKTFEPRVKIETPDEYDNAAKILKQEAKKKREAAEMKMTAKEKKNLEAQKQKEKEEKDKKAEEKRQKEETLLQEKAKEIARSELIDDKKFREEVKGDLSKSDMEALKKLEDDPILTPEDKKVIRELIEKGEIRGKNQIENTIKTYRKERAKGQTVIRDTVKEKEINQHLKRIAKTATSLSNLITTLSAQFTNHPETLRFLPSGEAARASLALASLGATITEFKKTCENASKENKEQKQMEAKNG